MSRTKDRKGNKRCPRCGFHRKLLPANDGSEHACQGCLRRVGKNDRRPPAPRSVRLVEDYLDPGSLVELIPWYLRKRSSG